MAILAVLAFHGGTRLKGGFIGVDIFFVLSGFLITTLLLQEWSERGGKVEMRGFYGRRARRLLPALFVTITAVGVIYVFDGSLNHGFAFPWQALAAIFYAGNWVIAFDPGSPLGLLNHTWSLAIEEQFYILWPPLLVVALRSRWSRERLAMVLVVAAAVSAALRAALWIAGLRQGLYFRSDTHADGLLLGCAFAAARGTPAMDQIQRLVRPQIVPLGVAIVLTGVALTVGPNDEFLFLVGYPLVAICSAALIIHTVTAKGSMVTRTLSSQPLVWIGARSYGMYLFHLPLMSVVSAERLGIAFWPGFILRIAAIFAAAALSYRFIESRFLRKNRYPGAPPHVQRATEQRDE